jgi:hypothetical protein
LFKEDRNLQKDIKLIGIGMGNQPDEIQTYRTAFKVEFPLFPDSQKEIQEKLKVKAVPMTVLMDTKGKVLMSHVGPIDNFDAFVSEIKKNLQTL